jgi:hypothetical protein
MHAKGLHQFATQLLAENPAMFHNRRVKVAIDVDPVSLL